jgi:hypothetical protein
MISRRIRGSLLASALAIGCHDDRPAEVPAEVPVSPAPGKPAATPGDVGVPASAPGVARLDYVKDSENRARRASVSWLDASNKTVWTHPLPPRLGFSICCWNEETEAYLKDPRHGTWSEIEDIVVTNGTLILEDEGEMLVLSLADGHALFDWTDDRTDEQRDRFNEGLMDYGTVSIRAGGETCDSKVNAQRFVRACGGRLVSFDRGLLAVFGTKPYALVAKKPVRGTEQACETPQKPVDRTVTTGDATVHMKGTRVTMCVD